MKLASFLSVVAFAVLALRLSAQDCARLAGNWTVQDFVALKYCAAGKCTTSYHSGETSIGVTQSACGISFNVDAVAPDTGAIELLQRTGSVACVQVFYSGALGLSATGLVYTTNWIVCAGRLQDDQIVFTCTGRATGTAQGTTFTLDLSGTSIWRNGPVQPAPVISEQPTDRVAGMGSNVTVSVTATGPCLRFQWRHNGLAIPGATNSSLTLRRIRPSDAGAYSVFIHNFAGSVLSQEATLEVADLTPPTVAITSPRMALRVTNDHIRFAGTAADNVGVVGVSVSVNDEPDTLAEGTNRWSADVALVPGTNIVRVQALDQAGNSSAVASRRIFYAVTTPLVIEKIGNGTIRPDLNGRRLEIGRTYTVTAVPAAGWLFADWSGGAESTAATLRFVHDEGLSLTAQFVENPYPALAGVYRGLFSESPQTRPESSGALSLTLASSGAFSGSLRNAGRTWPFTGRFDAFGFVSLAIGAAGTNQWQIDLALALDDGTNSLTGTVSRAGWEAALLGGRAVYNARTNPAPFAPRHTFLISGVNGVVLTNAGYGFGTVTNTRGGSATLTGTLADNTPIVWTAPMLRDRMWPFYQSLYGGRGCVIGLLQFRSESPAGFHGLAAWIRPANSNVVWYPAGFTNTVGFTGSSYVPPVSSVDRVLTLESGEAVFSRGPFVVAFTNRFTLSARGVATNLSATAFSLSIRPATGLFTGSVLPPGSSTRLPIKGAVLQNNNLGGGLVEVPWAYGRVTIGPTP